MGECDGTPYRTKTRGLGFNCKHVLHSIPVPHYVCVVPPAKQHSRRTAPSLCKTTHDPTQHLALCRHRSVQHSNSNTTYGNIPYL